MRSTETSKDSLIVTTAVKAVSVITIIIILPIRMVMIIIMIIIIISTNNNNNNNNNNSNNNNNNSNNNHNNNNNNNNNNTNNNNSNNKGNKSNGDRSWEWDPPSPATKAQIHQTMQQSEGFAFKLPAESCWLGHMAVFVNWGVHVLQQEPYYFGSTWLGPAILEAPVLIFQLPLRFRLCTRRTYITYSGS